MALKPIPNREHPPSTSLFLLNQQCQKTDEQMSVPNPTFLSNQAAAINHSRIITLIQIPSSSPFPNQTQERVRWPPEATAALVLNRVIRATPPICQTVFYKITRKTGTNCNRWGICGRGTSALCDRPALGCFLAVFAACGCADRCGRRQGMIKPSQTAAIEGGLSPCWFSMRPKHAPPCRSPD